MNTRMSMLGAGLIVLALGLVAFVMLGPRSGTGPTRELIEIEYRLGQPLAPRTVQVRQGDTVALRVTSEVSGELHVHGYDRTAEVGPGQPAAIDFVADSTGRFEFELEGAGAALGVIEVLPR